MVVLLAKYECSLREKMSVQLVLVSSPIFQNKNGKEASLVILAVEAALSMLLLLLRLPALLIVVRSSSN